MSMCENRKMLQFHRGELMNQLGLSAFVLVFDLFNFTQNERTHLAGMKAEPG